MGTGIEVYSFCLVWNQPQVDWGKVTTRFPKLFKPHNGDRTRKVGSKAIDSFMAAVGIILPQQGFLPGPHQFISVSGVLATGGQQRPAPDIYHLVLSQDRSANRALEAIAADYLSECLLLTELGAGRNEKGGI